MDDDFFLIAAILAVAAAVLGSLAAGVTLVVRDTIRRDGRWGINFDAANIRCPECGARAPIVRVPKNLRQALWGGHTCDRCGCEFDKWGREVRGGT